MTERRDDEPTAYDRERDEAQMETVRQSMERRSNRRQMTSLDAMGRRILSAPATSADPPTMPYRMAATSEVPDLIFSRLYYFEGWRDFFQAGRGLQFCDFRI